MVARDAPAPQVASSRPPRRRGRLAALVAIGLATIAATAWIVRDAPAPAPLAGARSVAARESITLGRRGVAVAEAGAALAWQIGRDGAARVDQTAGDIFYRVEPGGAFVVATPAGDVRATGTCFRVAIDRDPSAVVVTVYEGGVVVAGADGTEQRAAAGEQLTIGGDRPAGPR